MNDEQQEAKRQAVIRALRAHMEHTLGEPVTEGRVLEWLYQHDALDVFVAGAMAATHEMVTEAEAQVKWADLKQRYEQEYADK